jgi:3-hydroxyisobutyrate dehydrogenase
MKIALIGLGAMGYPMARNLARDHEVTVWNRTTALAERHAAEHGTRLARGLADCSDAAVIITVLPTSTEVDTIVEHLAGDLAPGTLWIDATSGDPIVSRATAEHLEKIGIDFVDAPVTGGTPGAEAGTLTIMIGGSEAAFIRAEAVLRSCGRNIFHVGSVGTGHAIKAINNAMLAANLWIAAEGLVSLDKQGFEMKTALEVLNVSSGRSNVTENLLPKRLVEGDWPLTFKLALLDKDVRIAANMVHHQHLASPMLALVSNLFTAARRTLGEEADYIDVVEYVAQLSGESLKRQ